MVEATTRKIKIEKGKPIRRSGNERKKKKEGSLKECAGQEKGKIGRTKQGKQLKKEEKTGERKKGGEEDMREKENHSKKKVLEKGVKKKRRKEETDDEEK